jgi:ketosteroid isomerase-like protein
VSREHLRLVLGGMRAASAVPKPDFATVNEVYAADHVFVPLNTERGEHELRGAEGWRTWRTDWAEVLPREDVEVEGAVHLGPDKVVTVMTSRRRAAASGLPLEQRVWFLVTVGDGKIKRTEAYADPGGAVRAAGLSD